MTRPHGVLCFLVLSLSVFVHGHPFSALRYSTVDIVGAGSMKSLEVSGSVGSTVDSSSGSSLPTRNSISQFGGSSYEPQGGTYDSTNSIFYLVGHVSTSLNGVSTTGSQDVGIVAITSVTSTPTASWTQLLNCGSSGTLSTAQFGGQVDSSSDLFIGGTTCAQVNSQGESFTGNAEMYLVKLGTSASCTGDCSLDVTTLSPDIADASTGVYRVYRDSSGNVYLAGSSDAQSVSSAFEGVDISSYSSTASQIGFLQRYPSSVASAGAPDWTVITGPSSGSGVTVISMGLVVSTYACVSGTTTGDLGSGLTGSTDLFVECYTPGTSTFVRGMYGSTSSTVVSQAGSAGLEEVDGTYYGYGSISGSNSMEGVAAVGSQDCFVFQFTVGSDAISKGWFMRYGVSGQTTFCAGIASRSDDTSIIYVGGFSSQDTDGTSFQGLSLTGAKAPWILGLATSDGSTTWSYTYGASGVTAIITGISTSIGSDNLLHVTGSTDGALDGNSMSGSLDGTYLTFTLDSSSDDDSTLSDEEVEALSGTASAVIASTVAASTTVAVVAAGSSSISATVGTSAAASTTASSGGAGVGATSAGGGSSGSSLGGSIGLVFAIQNMVLLGNIDMNVPDDVVSLSKNLAWTNMQFDMPWTIDSGHAESTRRLRAANVFGTSPAELWVTNLFWVVIGFIIVVHAHCCTLCSVHFCCKRILRRRKYHLSGFFRFPKWETLYFLMVYQGLSLSTWSCIRDASAVWVVFAVMFLIFVLVPFPFILAFIICRGIFIKKRVKYQTNNMWLVFSWKKARDIIVDRRKGNRCVNAWGWFLAIRKIILEFKVRGDWVKGDKHTSVWLELWDHVFSDFTHGAALWMPIDLLVKLFRGFIIGVINDFSGGGYTQLSLLFVIPICHLFMLLVFGLFNDRWNNFAEIWSTFWYCVMVLVMFFLPETGETAVNGISEAKTRSAIIAMAFIGVIGRLIYNTVITIFPFVGTMVKLLSKGPAIVWFVLKQIVSTGCGIFQSLGDVDDIALAVVDGAEGQMAGDGDNGASAGDGGGVDTVGAADAGAVDGTAAASGDIPVPATNQAANVATASAVPAVVMVDAGKEVLNTVNRKMGRRMSTDHAKKYNSPSRASVASIALSVKGYEGLSDLDLDTDSDDGGAGCRPPKIPEGCAKPVVDKCAIQ